MSECVCVYLLGAHWSPGEGIGGFLDDEIRA